MQRRPFIVRFTRHNHIAINVNAIMKHERHNATNAHAACRIHRHRHTARLTFDVSPMPCRMAWDMGIPRNSVVLLLLCNLLDWNRILWFQVKNWKSDMLYLLTINPHQLVNHFVTPSSPAPFSSPPWCSTLHRHTETDIECPNGESRAEQRMYCFISHHFALHSACNETLMQLISWKGALIPNSLLLHLVLEPLSK